MDGGRAGVGEMYPEMYARFISKLVCEVISVGDFAQRFERDKHADLECCGMSRGVEGVGKQRTAETHASKLVHTHTHRQTHSQAYLHRHNRKYRDEQNAHTQKATA